MKEIACIHTVSSVIEPFTRQLREGIPGEFRVHTLYDDFLITDASPAGHNKFTAVNHQRLRLDMQAQALTGADIIVVTCSTLSPSVRLLQGEFNVPIVTIDDAMVHEAVQRGTKIGMIATADSTVRPSSSALRAAAADAGREIDLKVLCNEAAIQALKAGDRAAHDRIVLEMSDQMKDRDVIVLAQASAADLEQTVEQRTGITTLSSPARCVAQLRRLMEALP